MRIFFLLLLIGLLTACDATPSPALTPTIISAAPITSLQPVSSALSAGWGEVYAPASADQGEAPSLAVLQDFDGTKISLAWSEITRLKTRIFDLDSRLWSVDRQLELPISRPYAMQLFPGGLGMQHLLWLDAWVTPEGDLENRLLSALVPLNAPIQRGSLAASSLPTVRYSAVPDGNDGVWAVWSGGLPERPDLHITYIDSAGRPRPSRSLMLDADWPILLTTSAYDPSAGAVAFDLFWMQTTTRTMYHGYMADEKIYDATPLLRLPGLKPGDAVMSFTAGIDQTHLYLFWNIVTITGEAQTWMASAPFVEGGSGVRGLGNWAVSAALGVDVSETSGVQTGFNSGLVYEAQTGQQKVAWAAPLVGSEGGETLPVAAQVGDKLAVVYFQHGEVIGYQDITALDVGGLIAPPIMTADVQRYLYLAWSGIPDEDDAPAQLLFTSTRP